MMKTNPLVRIILAFYLTGCLGVLAQNKNALQKKITELQSQLKSNEEDAKAIMESYEKSLQLSDQKILALEKQIQQMSAGKKPVTISKDLTALRKEMAEAKKEAAEKEKKLVAALDEQVRLRVAAEEERKRLVNTQDKRLQTMLDQEAKKLQDMKSKLDQQVKERLAAEQKVNDAQRTLQDSQKKMNQEVDSLRRQVRDLTTKNQALEKAKGKPTTPAPTTPAPANQRVKDLEAQVTQLRLNLKEEKDRARKALATEQETNDALAVQVAKLSEDLKKAKAGKPAGKPSDQAKELQAEIQELETTLAARDQELKQLEKQSSQVTEMAKQNTEMGLQIADLKLARNKMQSTLTRQVDDINSLTRERDALRKAKDEITTEQTALQKKYEAASIEIVKLRKDFSDADLRANKLDNDLKRASSEAQALRQKLGTMEKESVGQTDNLAALKTEIERLRIDNDKLSAENKSAKTQMIRLDSKLLDVTRENAELSAGLRLKDAERLNAVNKLEDVLEAGKKEKEELEKTIREKDRELEIMARLQTDKDGLIQDLKSREADIDRLNTELEQLRPLVVNNQRMQEDLVRVRTQLTEAETERRDLKKTLADTEKKAQDFSDKSTRTIATYIDKEKEYTARVLALSTTNAMHEVSLVELEKLLGEKKAQIETKDNLVTDLNAQLKVTNEQLSRSQKDLDEARLERKTVSRELTEVKAELQRMRGDYSVAKETTVAQQKRIEDLISTNQIHLARIDALNEDLADFTKTKATLGRTELQLQQANVNLALKTKEYDELKKEKAENDDLIAREHETMVKKLGEETAALKEKMDSETGKLIEESDKLAFSLKVAEERLVEAQEETKAADEEIKVLTDQVSDLMAKNKNFEDTKKNLEQARTLLEQTKTEVTQVKKERDTLKGNLQKVTSSDDRGKATILQQKQRIQELEGGIAANQKTYELKLHQLQQSVDDLSSRLDESKALSSRREKDLDVSRKQVNDLQTKLATSEGKVIELLNQQRRIIERLKRLLDGGNGNLPADLLKPAKPAGS